MLCALLTPAWTGFIAWKSEAMSKKTKVVEISPEVRAEVRQMNECKATAEEIAARSHRWRRAVEKRIRECDANQSGYYLKSSLFEQIEGRPLVDVIMDSLMAGRSKGISAYIDRDYDEAPTRCRNRHDREVASFPVHIRLVNWRRIDERTAEAIISKFGKPGDVGIEDMIERAIRQIVAE